ncbi:MAG: 5-formyltetrahydrofolate cyclo-ligase [Agathobacter sp.]|nr:5-formyltetrahydrofolate cyclo-ligase [Agathobacter sp.]
METKNQVRKKCRLLRNDISFLYRQYASYQICKKLLESDWYAECDRILLYMATQNEVDLSAFMERAWADKKKLYFPKVIGEEMDFYLAESMCDFKTGSYGILEPDTMEPISLMLIDKTPMLVPGVAFSNDGYRIGYGKGYYDRYLITNQKNKRLIPIGIAYSFQVVDAFETDPHDYPMRTVITDVIQPNRLDTN